MNPPMVTFTTPTTNPPVDAVRRYELLDLVGEGRNGEVYKAVDLKLTRLFAIKIIPFHNKESGFPSDVMRKIALMAELEHNNVIRIHTVERLPGYSYGCRLVMEYGESNLSRYIVEHAKRGIPPEKAKLFLLQILQGLKHCHSRKVMHRNLRPANILLTANEVIKLSGFGSSDAFDVPNLQNNHNVGILRYRAPEMLLALPYTNLVDIWAVGCVFAELVASKPLFDGTSNPAVMMSIGSIFGVPTPADLKGASSYFDNKLGLYEPKNVEPRISLARLVPNLSRKGLDLLQKMLCINPCRRITAANALRHPFFKDLHAERARTP
ncbi:cell division control protein 2 homolog A-like [Andrographis paniculata]|uniref:cell division control protein 2 homolog A-like n=1 Tax=Andrographis paniculata TaxID=175694 RepID=UPI0021E9AB30|nr:cell division control protein 2 homolog A-like [Andrographis paniculata]